MSTDDELTETQREVDEMLPGTPRIGPPPPTPKEIAQGWRWTGRTVEVPADSPGFRRRVDWGAWLWVISGIALIFGCGIRMASYEAQRDDDRKRIEKIRDEINGMRFDLAIAGERFKEQQRRIEETNERMREFENRLRQR